MSVANGELAFLADLSGEPKICVDSNDDGVNDGIGLPNEDDDDLLSCSTDNTQEGIYGRPDGQPYNKEVMQHRQQGGQVDVQIRPPVLEIADPPSTTENGHPEETTNSPPIPRSRSIAHHSFVNGKAIILSLDIETGGNTVEYYSYQQRFVGWIFNRLGNQKRMTRPPILEGMTTPSMNTLTLAVGQSSQSNAPIYIISPKTIHASEMQVKCVLCGAGS